MYIPTLGAILPFLVLALPALAAPAAAPTDACGRPITTTQVSATPSSTARTSMAASVNTVKPSSAAVQSSTKAVVSSAPASVVRAASTSAAAVATSKSSAAPVVSSVAKSSSVVVASSKSAVPVVSSSAAKPSSMVASSSKPVAPVVSSTVRSSSVAAQPTPSSSALTGDPKVFVDLHNAFRAQYGAKPLGWNATLASYASNYAKQCVFKHSGGPYGENLAAGVGGGYNITMGFNAWADEASAYNASNPQYSHFTQVVWKATTQVGCVAVPCADGTIFTGYGQNSLNIVCEYYPRGNYIGQFGQNVGAKQ
ncbi:hypothetical protein IAR55_004890 [Kwoniella newhampshirensis]|uniref:SCP domain-containing protein n=1 Tax=Kwoniella newhampshirensis TaxID=1651941 RepID=A0AAW0YWV4_9TREE